MHESARETQRRAVDALVLNLGVVVLVVVLGIRWDNEGCCRIALIAKFTRYSA